MIYSPCDCDVCLSSERPDDLLGPWEPTPWLWRKLFRKPAMRRRIWVGWIPEPDRWEYDNGTKALAGQ